MSRSDAKKRREPGTACGKDPSLCHGPRLARREKPGWPSWTSTGICVPSGAGGRADGAAPSKVLLTGAHVPRLGKGATHERARAKAKRSRIAPPPNE